MRPHGLVGLATAGALLLSAGVAQADIVPVTSTPIVPVTSTPVQPVTSTPVQPVTSTPVQPVTSTPVQPVTSTPVAPYHAQQVAFYHATIIRRLPPSLTISHLLSHGGGFSLPAHCNYACSLWSWAITDNLAGLLLDRTVAARAVQLGSAHTSLSHRGNLKLRLRLSSKALRALRHARRPVKVTVNEVVIDSAHKWVKVSVQHITLRPGR